VLHERNSAEPGGVNEVITGLSIDTDGAVNIEIDADKVCHYIGPDGEVVTSTDGKIETTWGGDPGKVILLIPKNSYVLHLGSAGAIGTASDFSGDFVTNFAGLVQLADCALLTSVNAPNTSELICAGCAALTDVSALKANILDCSNCVSLAEQSIYDALDNAYKLAQGGMIEGDYDFSGATTGIVTSTISQMHGISYNDIITYLSGAPNWVIQYNEAA
jgi:hypothetical protein